MAISPGLIRDFTQCRSVITHLSRAVYPNELLTHRLRQELRPIGARTLDYIIILESMTLHRSRSSAEHFNPRGNSTADI
jgi:hypothetical protein